MEVIHNITTDLTRRPVAVHLDAVQGDTNTRRAKITLLSDGQPWVIPEGVGVLARYRKGDGTSGSYEADAHIDGNTVTLAIDQQVLQTPGEAEFQAVLIGGESSLSIFAVRITVQPNLAEGQ